MILVLAHNPHFGGGPRDRWTSDRRCASWSWTVGICRTRPPRMPDTIAEWVCNAIHSIAAVETPPRVRPPPATSTDGAADLRGAGPRQRMGGDARGLQHWFSGADKESRRGDLRAGTLLTPGGIPGEDVPREGLLSFRRERGEHLQGVEPCRVKKRQKSGGDSRGGGFPDRC